MTFETITLDIRQGVARLALNRPDKMNSFNGTMHDELRAALQQVQDDASVRVLVLTGHGRGFCAGQDLADAEVRFVPGEGTPPDLGDVVERRYKPLVMQLASLRVPTIAAVNGIAAGAGASLALVCDMVVAIESAAFMLPFAKIGLIPDTACSWIVPQRLGFARAMGLALTGEKLPATKAAEWGLIWEAVPDAEFEAVLGARAKWLAEGPTAAFMAIREALRASDGNDMAAQLQVEARLQGRMGATRDFAEGVAAFLQKRAPQFQGR